MLDICILLHILLHLPFILYYMFFFSLCVMLWLCHFVLLSLIVYYFFLDQYCFTIFFVPLLFFKWLDSLHVIIFLSMTWFILLLFYLVFFFLIFIWNGLQFDISYHCTVYAYLFYNLCTMYLASEIIFNFSFWLIFTEVLYLWYLSLNHRYEWSQLMLISEALVRDKFPPRLYGFAWLLLLQNYLQ